MHERRLAGVVTVRPCFCRCCSVASADCYRTVEKIVLEAKAANPKMAVVVSAMGGKPKVGEGRAAKRAGSKQKEAGGHDGCCCDCWWLGWQVTDLLIDTVNFAAKNQVAEYEVRGDGCGGCATAAWGSCCLALPGGLTVVRLPVCMYVAAHAGDAAQEAPGLCDGPADGREEGPVPQGPRPGPQVSQRQAGRQASSTGGRRRRRGAEMAGCV